MNSSAFSPQTHKMNGMTLIELMVTLSVLTVLMVLAIPSFQSMIASSRLATASNDFYAMLSLARSNAIKSGHRVTVCKSANGTQCATTGNWEQGWIMFNDFNRSGTTASLTTVGTAVDSLIYVAPALPVGLVLNGNMTYVSFAADGLPKTMTGGFLSGTLRLCSTSTAINNDKRARNFVMNSAGRVTVERPTGIASTCPAP